MIKQSSSNPLISVIVPVYNTEKYLKRCINSLLQQTYQKLEIILINDGSTDGSEQIVNDFAEKDKRVKAIHKENGGESNARNIGLKIATGEYITFCDCDDWIDVDMYKCMMEVLLDNNIDMVAVSWYYNTDLSTCEIKNELPVSDSIFGREELLNYIYMRDSYRGFAYIWNKLYKREILYTKQGSLILFDETLQLGGDVLYMAEIALNVKRVKYIDRAFYHYNQREDSGCHTKDVRKLRDWIRAYELVIHRFEEEHIDKCIIDYVKRFLAYHSSNAVEIAIEQNQFTAKKEFQDLMQRYKQEYISLNLQHPKRIKRYRNLLTQ